MSIGEIAGLIAAIAFAVLSGFLIYPLIRMGKMFDQIAQTVKDTGEHAVPVIDESVETVRKVNKTLEDANDVSSALSATTDNIASLTDLYSSVLGKPIIKVASFAWAAKETAKNFFGKKGKENESDKMTASRPQENTDYSEKEAKNV